MIKIIADSTCDLSNELIKKYDIDILPLHVHLGNKEFQDGKNITPDEIYEWSDKYNLTPKTSAISLLEAAELFEKYLNGGYEIICFSVSDEMSSTGNIMKMAVSELNAEDKIHIINSQNLSTGIGLLIIEAAIMIKNGNKCSEIINAIEDLKKNVKSSFVVDTLTYLHRGGRCNSMVTLAGNALKLHPQIVVKDGKLLVARNYRGKINSVINAYVSDIEAELKNAKPDRVFITHSGCSNSIIKEVYTFLKKMDLFDEILVTQAGAVISSHCGPGTLGVLFISK